MLFCVGSTSPRQTLPLIDLVDLDLRRAVLVVAI